MSSSTSSSSGAGCGKAPLALLVALALVMATALPLYWSYGEFVSKRHPDFTRSKRFVRFFEPRTEDTPLVLTLGDSTLRSPIPFPTQVGAWIKEPIEMRTLWVLGLSQGEASLIVSRALELEPDALMLVAHFAMFESEQPLRLRELLRGVPLARLPEIAGLPFTVRGVGVGELLFSSVVGALVPEPWIEAKRGGARWLDFELRKRWRVIPGSEDHREAWVARARQEAMGRNVRPFYASHPSIEMVRGTVRMAERRGVEVLVVVSPVHITAIDAAVGFDAERFAASVADLRGVVEAEGGDLIDLHAALTPEQFTDDLGHYYASGAREIAIPAEVWTRRVLGYPPVRRGGGRGDRS